MTNSTDFRTVSNPLSMGFRSKLLITVFRELVASFVSLAESFKSRVFSLRLITLFSISIASDRNREERNQPKREYSTLKGLCQRNKRSNEFPKDRNQQLRPKTH